MSGLRRVVAVGLMLVLASFSVAQAQEQDGGPLAPSPVAKSLRPKTQGLWPKFEVAKLKQSGRWIVPGSRLPQGSVAPAPKKQSRPMVQRILWSAAAGAGGFFGGLYLGAWIEGDRCNCDDPGLQGALIGAPIGAAVGAILGWTLSK